MPSSKTDTFGILQDTLDFRTCGLIWLTDDSITARPRHFSEIDYFVDGVLTQSIFQDTHPDQDRPTNLMVTKHFGKPFFIGHIQVVDNWQKRLQDTFKAVEGLQLAGKTVLVLDDTRSKASTKLKSKVGGKRLEILTLD